MAPRNPSAGLDGQPSPETDPRAPYRAGVSPCFCMTSPSEAVAEMEAAWGQRLGPERFDQLRSLLIELNELA